MLPMAHLTSHSRMSGSRWVIIPFWLSGSLKYFSCSSSVYSFHLFLIFWISLRYTYVQASQVALVVKKLPANAGDIRDLGSIPGLGTSPGGGPGNLLQYSCLEIPVDRGAWWAAVRGVTKSQTRLGDWTTITPNKTDLKFPASLTISPWNSRVC